MVIVYFYKKTTLMNKCILLVLIASLTACQTTKIKERTYKVSNATTEIGSVGQSKSLYKISNDFSTHAFPYLANKIRVEVNVLPFNKKLNKFYLEKAKYNQGQAKINYIDSLAVKPEMVTISILDISSYISEINSDNNKEVLTYLKDTKKAKIIISIASTMSSENISKIKQADAYYLINNQLKKYTLVLYKENKKTETIDLQSGVVLAYELSKTCWAVNKKANWYLADIVNECNSCKGNTHSKIKEEKVYKSLYDM